MNSAVKEPIQTSVFLARQPILDRDQELFAYELLYRNGNTGFADVKDENFATTKLITNTFMSFGIENISNQKPVFINLPRDFITGKLPLPFGKDNIVLEVLEDIEADEESLKGIKKLHDAGFTIALDDFILSDNNSKFMPFADIIKVDLTLFTKEELKEEYSRLAGFNKLMLAEKVETDEEFQFCLELGFHYFQGYFFARPKVLENKELSTNQLTLLNLLAKLQDPELCIQDIESIISNDVAISFKLLKIINSSLYNFTKKIESIQHALIVLGLHTIKQWLMLLNLSSIEDKPSELISQTLVRAKMCEEVAKQLKLKPESAFAVGMFSLLDALMDKSLDQIMASLPLADDITEAILDHTGELGKLLVSVIHYEKGEWDAIDTAYFTKGSMNIAYEEAIKWEKKITEELLG